MFKFINQIWSDTTKVDKRYVAKDVKGMLTFLVGLLFLIATAVVQCFGKVISFETIGFGLLAYSLGGQAFKSHYQTKSLAILNGCADEKDSSKEES